MATKATSFIPKGYHTVTPYLLVRDAAKAIDFYKKALNATEIARMPGPDGRIAHAEVRIGDSRIMLADEAPERNMVGPQSLGGVGVGLCVYVEDCDLLLKQAIAAGAKVEQEVADQFYGDRAGTVLDPFGHRWTVMTHKEDMSVEEMAERMPKQ